MHEVAHSKVTPLLVELCNGPAGPLAAIDLNSPLPPVDDKKKKKGKSAKPKKKVESHDVLPASGGILVPLGVSSEVVHLMLTIPALCHDIEAATPDEAEETCHMWLYLL